MSKKKNTQVTNNPKLITADQFREQEQQKQNSNLMTAEDFTRRQQANAAMTGGINGVYNSLRNADNLQKAQAVNRVAAGAAVGTGVGSLQSGSDIDYLRYLDETMFRNNPENEGKQYTTSLERLGKVGGARKLIESGGQKRSAIDDIGGFTRDWNDARYFGLNDTKKPVLMSDEQLDAYNDYYQKQYEDATAKETRYQESPMMQAANKAKDVVNRYNAGKWQHLSQQGVPYGMNKDGEYVYTDIKDWQGLNQDEWLKARPEDYYENDNRDYKSYDRAMYDAVHGRGAYDKRLDALETDEEVDAFEKELDEMWDSLENGGFENKYNEAYGNMTDARQHLYGYYGSEQYKSKLQKGESEAERRELIARMEAEAPEISGEYNLKADEGHAADKIYFKANNPFFDENSSERDRYNHLREESFMTQEQIDTFNRYYNAGMKDEALAYYEGLKPALTSMMQTARDQYEYDLALNGDIGMIAHRILTQPVAGVTGTLGATMALLGNEAAQDEDNEFFYGLTRKNQNISAGRQQAWGNISKDAFVATEQFVGKLLGADPRLVEAAMEATGVTDTAEAVGKYANGIVYSMVDNIVARTIGMGIGKLSGLGSTSNLAGALIQVIMSSEATANEMVTNLRNGMDPTESAIRAVSSGVIEAITEKYSIDRFFENYGVGSVWRQMVANMIPEGTEEVASDILEMLIDFPISYIFGHKTEIEDAVDSYIASGMDPTEAWKQALLDKTGDIALSFMAGGISGGVMGGYGAVQHNISVGNIGKKISAEINTTASGVTGRQQLVDTAAAMDGTKSQELAETIKAKQAAANKGEKIGEITNYEIGQLAMTMMQETGEKYAKIAQETMQRIVRDQLTDAGVKAGQVEMIAQAIVSGLYKEGKLTKEEMNTIAQSSAAINLWKTYNAKGTVGNVARTVLNMKTKAELAADTEAEQARSVRDLVDSMVNPAEEGTNKYELITKDAKTATQEELDSAEGERTNNYAEAIVQGTISDITGISVNKKNGKPAQIRIQTADGRTVDAADVQAVNLNVAKIVALAQKDGGRTTSTAMLNTLLKYAKTTDDIAGMINEAQKIRWAVVLGQEAPKTKLKKNVAQEFLQGAQDDYAAAEEARLKNNVDLQPGKGRAVYNGKEYGTKEFTDALQGLNANQRREATIVAKMAKAAGLDLEIINDPEMDATFGNYAGGARIMVNLAGTNSRGDYHSVVVSLGHEITHMLEANSKEGYAALRNYVLNNLANTRGFNLTRRIQDKMDTYEHYDKYIDIFGAVSEVVADSCDQILTNEKAIRALMNNDPSLYRSIQRAVGKLVAKIRDAMASIRGSASNEARALMGKVDDIAKLWSKAFEEANGVKGTAEEGAGEEQFAFRNIDITEKAIKQNQIEVSEMDAIIAEDSKLFKMGNGLFKQIKKYYAGPNKYVKSNVFGTIEFTSGKLSDSFGHGMTPLKAATYAVLPDVLKVGKVVNYVELFEDPNYDTAILAAPVVITEGPLKGEYYVGAVVKLYRDGSNKYYTHDGVVAIKNIGDGTTTIFDPDSTASDTKKQEYTGSNKGGNHRTIESVLNELPPRNVKSGTEGQNSFRDDSYMAAVERGDMETAQRLVDEAAEEAGYTYKAFHGTTRNFNTFRFTEDDLGIHLGTKGQARMMAGRGKDARIIEAYVKLNNPIHFERDLGAWEGKRVAKELYDMSIITEQEAENALLSADRTYRLSDAKATKNIRDLLISKGYDGFVYDNDFEGYSKKSQQSIAVFDPSQIKVADPVTYDNDGNVIPLSERFNKENPDIRYSLRDEEIRNEDGDVLAEEFAPDSITKYSLRTWEQTDVAELTKQLIERGFKKKDVTKWIRDVNGIAKMIADNRDRLDYEATSGRMLKNNQEYIKTLDASTLCAKRLLYQGIYNEIQHMLPDTPLMPEDLIRLINMMKKRGLVTPCGICYVESRRRMLGKYASEWLKNYDGEYKPTLEEVTTTDGLEALRNEPEGSAKRQAYDDFVAAMNAKGSANPKVVQLRTDYKPGEIRDMTASQVQKVKDIGGLRVQSFSDFEVVHMIDMMQAVLDMAAMDLTSQAYTKVPEFAWVFGGTGIKINLSLIGKGTGVDADGNLLFDDVEGMPFEKAMELRRAYSKNVGTILVGMNDEHIIAAMGSDDIDFIIPFHKSGWSKREMGQVIGMASYKDYTRFQNEKLIEGKKANGRGYQTIPNKKSKISNLTPVGKEGYWQFKKDGIWNAENYLKKCAEQHRMPKFANFLIDNGDGSFRLPTEQEAAESKRMANIRKGYWKLLIDFKMYDNEGNGAEQVEVRPDFNMEKAQEILENYEGGANKLPKNHALAQEFVDDYRKTHRNVRVIRQLADSEGSLSVRDDTEAQLRQEYDEAREKYEDLRNQISELKGELNELNERIRKAKEEDLDALAEEAMAWDERTGYGKLNKELQAAEKAERAARKALEEYSDKLDVEEEQEKIRKSGKSEADWRRDRAVDQYGYTTDYREAGYLLPNGKMLNFTGSKGQHYGMRGNDHRDIGIIYASGEMQGSPAMLAFMNDGNIRVMAETPGVDISTAHEPTTAQYNMIRNMAYRFEREEYFSVDLTDERGNNVGSFEYDGKINPSRIVNDIRDYFRTGEVREQSLTSMFHESGQFSIRDEMDFDVKHWMMSVNENSLQTEAEKVLLRQFKDLNMKEQLYRLREEDYRKRIQALESRGEENLDKDAKYELQGLRVRLANATKIKEQTQAEMGRITSSEGYGRMMRDQNRIFNDFMYGRTQAEVTDAVERLEKSSREIEKIIRENQAAVSEMEKSEVIQRLKKALGKTTIDQAAADLKKAFRSTWTRNEIKVYLEPILVKMANGENFESDVEELASILVASDSENTYEGLEDLRGLQIVVGKSQLKELRAAHSSIKELRRRLAGSGITIKAGDYATLDNGFDNLLETYPTLRGRGLEEEAENASNIVEAFVSWVERAMEQSGSKQFYEQRMAEAIATIMQKVIGTASGIYIPAEARAQAQVLELVEYVKTLQARTEAAERTLEQLAQRAGQLHTEGLKAAGMANTLTTNVNEALEYFNTTAKLAVAQAKQNRQNQIIDQLKSDFAKKMAKSNEEWRNLIERDKNARAQAEENRRERSKINTAVKRMFRLLRDQSATKNMPEYMQMLAREVIEQFVDNDLDGGMKLTQADRNQLKEAKRLLEEWKKQNGAFDLNRLYDDLDEAQEAMFTVINQDLQTIYDAIPRINAEIRGKNKLDTLQQRGAILKEISSAVGEIYSAIQAERKIQIGLRKILVEDQAFKIMDEAAGKTRKEWTGRLGGAIRTMHKAIVSGNMTPEYFFRTIKNAGLTDLWQGYHYAENQNGLELAKAKARLDEIAKKYGYEAWDTKQKVTLKLKSGDVTITLGQLMSLYATWKRENTLGPAISEHLTKGGFYAEQDLRDGLLGRQVIEKRAHKVTKEDMAEAESLLTEDQKKFVDEIVGYMSTDMSEMGNEASMKAYGIKLYKEKYYFPFQMWDGVRSRKSSDAGAGANADQIFHPSFSKSRLHGANNAVVIGDFLRTATDHIAGMINYATMGLANENMQKVLNTQMAEGGELNGTKRNVWTTLEQAYGQDAVRYLRELQQQLNGGAVRTSKTIADKAITLFRKNAVAGSLSVAFQQPLSYIRAATMISPRYLTQALAREYWQGSYKELMAHSGVAVIKDMGRFDMNAGQSAREYLTPDGLQSRGRRIWNGITEYATILPELMDRWTWTRMWVAVKAEQHKLHPDMDMKSDEFLDLCGERFNDIMRRTQVYDSTLVKSANMRSDHWYIKSLTSFMAEPTVTLNVLTDSVRSAVQHEQGAARLVTSAAGTFILSAIFQAAIKAIFSSGRSPDDKKTWLENFLNRFGSNMISELDPLNLIPGYNDLITLLKKGELSDDAMGAVGKIWTSTRGIIDVVLGNGKNGTYRDLEDSVGQVLQLFTGLPAKNIMREVRAIYNWTLGSGSAYAQRPTSGAVLQNQLTESFYGADNLIGWINKELGDAGYKTDNAAYYERIYQAKKEGRNEDAQNYIDFLLNGRGVKQSTIEANIKKAAKADEDASASETAEFMMNEGADAGDYIKEQLKNGEIDAKEATTLLKKQHPDKSDDEIFWMVDRIEYQKETGNEASGQYYRFYDAMDSNKATDIQREVKAMLAHGMKPENIKKQITTKYKPLYLAADNKGKTKIRDEIHKAYKALGYSAEDADKVINKWKPEGDTSGSVSSGRTVGSLTGGIPNKQTKDEMFWENMYKNTTGKLNGKGNIDLNKRKVVHNPDGSISTERSFSVNIDGKEVLLPTVINGRIVSEDEAIDHYYETGEHLGKFDTVEEADEYAEKLHERQEWYYNGR